MPFVKLFSHTLLEVVTMTLAVAWRYRSRKVDESHDTKLLELRVKFIIVVRGCELTH